jgi:hypothetical protein
LEMYKSPSTDQILAEWLKQKLKDYILRSTNILILFGIRKNCHRNERNLLLYLFMKRVIKLFAVITEEHHC